MCAILAKSIQKTGEQNFMSRYEGVLICTDLDGTLLRGDKTISDANIKAIEYFKQKGGLFTFVTGRMPNFVDGIANIIKPNAPIGCVNGGGLYDYKSKKYLWKSNMPEEVSELVRCIDENYPDVGIMTCTFEKTYFSKENITMQKFRDVTNAPHFVCQYNDIKEPIAKIIFGSESDDEIVKISQTLKNHPLAERFDFIQSEQTLYEILPKGICKGTSVTKICELMNIDKSKTVALGDYNNDISMFCAAHTGIAVSNACSEAQKAADYVTVSNEEDAVAKVIYDIEEGKYL